MKKYPILGSHVGMNKIGNYLIGSVQETIANDGNALMIYTGPPQNSIRKSTSEFNITEFHELLKVHEISIDNVVVHAPYLINLANPVNSATWNFSVDFLTQEINRCHEIGIKILVLHPGAFTKGSSEAGLEKLILGLDAVTAIDLPVKIALETMSGKGTEVGISIEQLAYVIGKVQHPDRIGICIDTCHMNDAGYDLNNWNEIKTNLAKTIGLEKVWVFHINDSYNVIGAHKDRHANIGYGTIGFDTLAKIVWDEDFKEIPKILETPYLDKISPYKYEIKDLRMNQFNNELANFKDN